MVKPIKQLSASAVAQTSALAANIFQTQTVVSQLQRGRQCARRDGLWELVEEMGRGKGLL